MDRIGVSARVHTASFTKVTSLAPKRWTVRRAGKGYDTTTVQFTKRMTVPKDATVSFTATPVKDTRGGDYDIRGTKALWSVTASR